MKYFKKEEFNKELSRIKRSFDSLTVVIEDGRDENNANQNARFSGSMRAMEAIKSELANLELDGCDMDAVWNENPIHGLNLPENLAANIKWLIERYEQLAAE